MSYETIFDAGSEPTKRTETLRNYLTKNYDFPSFVPEANNHIHTCYSFSPYTPTAAALKARQAGLAVIGSVDHDSLQAAAEMQAACALLGQGCVTGIEIRAIWHRPEEIVAGNALFADRKLNNPDSAGIAYLTLQGIPATSREKVAKWLIPIRKARLIRTEQMTQLANDLLVAMGISPVNFERDVRVESQYNNGGAITERHLLYAIAKSFLKVLGNGPDLVAGLLERDIPVSKSAEKKLADPENPYLSYDLLGLLKAEFLSRFYLAPRHISEGGECPDTASVVSFAKEIGALCCYAYLGDIAQSPTGDKKAEKFEDSFLDELFEDLERLGIRAVTYMPPRNTALQLQRIDSLAREHEMMQISGVDINQPRQDFDCPQLRDSKFTELNNATWALVAHEQLAAQRAELGLLHPNNPWSKIGLAERIARYANIARVYKGKAATQWPTELKEII